MLVGEEKHLKGKKKTPGFTVVVVVVVATVTASGGAAVMVDMLTFNLLSKCIYK